MREPHEFEVGGKTFRATPMDARTQQHVARRVQPLLLSAIPGITAALPVIRASLKEKSVEKLTPEALMDLDLSAIMPAIQSPFDLLAQMPDETFDYVQSKALARVQRQKANDTGWVAIWSTQADRMLFEDIEGHEVQAIMLRVLIWELGPFFLGLVSNFKAPDQP